MLRNLRGNFEIIELLLRNLVCMCAHDQMNLVSGAINLLEQPLQIDRSAGAGRSDQKFHCAYQITTFLDAIPVLFMIAFLSFRAKPEAKSRNLSLFISSAEHRVRDANVQNRFRFGS